MDFQLSDEHKAVRNLAREFAQKELIPTEEIREREGVFHRELVPKMGALGFFGCAFPPEYGGTGLGFLAQTIIIEEIMRASIEAGYSFNVQSMIVPLSIFNWGNEDQRRKYVPALIKGEIIGCFSLTEPDCGSDAAAIKTRAVRDGDHYVINGSKMWATYGSVADLITLYAKTDPQAGHKGISAFLVETKDLPGLTRTKIPSFTGTKCIPSAEMVFEDCRIPKESLLGEEGQGFKIAMNTLDYGRITVPARSIGVAQAAVDAATKYANERVAFGQLIGKFQMIQRLIAEMVVDTEAARLMVYRTASLADNGQPFTREASIGKYFATSAAVRVCEAAAEIFGAYAFAEEYPIYRLLTVAKVLWTGEGSANIQRVLIAEDALGWKRMDRHGFKPKFAVETATL
ncbi:MAG: acyl-CoA dehydrogenase family protein [Chloroflexi bacterium]|nr:acyl-CoA dehydrogenase family protein [Chloroflexota bacterium]